MSCMQIKYFGMLSTYANLYLFMALLNKSNFC